MKTELSYNGYTVKNSETNTFISYEFINYGFIENNFSELVIRHYILNTMEFCSGTIYYKDSFLFKRFLSKYLKMLQGAK